jgi:hypothetical protein
MTDHSYHIIPWLQAVQHALATKKAPIRAEHLMAGQKTFFTKEQQNTSFHTKI